jgi:uncharacterized FlaG/YvyC family protein
MSGISIITTSAASLAVASAKTPAQAPHRTFSAGQDVLSAAPVVTERAVAKPKPVDDAKHETQSRLKERLRAIAEGFGGNTDLVIRVDAESNRYVYEFRDGKSGEVIRQYPEADLATVLKEQNFAEPGLFVSTTA